MKLDDYTEPAAIADEYAPRPKASQIAAAKRKRDTPPDPPRDPRRQLLGIAAMAFVLAIIGAGMYQLAHTPTRPLPISTPAQVFKTAPTAAPAPTSAPLPSIVPSAPPVPTEAPVAAPVAPVPEPQTGQGMTWVEPAPVEQPAPEPVVEAAPVVEIEKNSRPVDANDWCSGVHLSDPKCQNHDYDRAEKMKVSP